MKGRLSPHEGTATPQTTDPIATTLQITEQLEVALRLTVSRNRIILTLLLMLSTPKHKLMLSLIIDLTVIKDSSNPIQYTNSKKQLFLMDEDFVPRLKYFWNFSSKRKQILPSLLNTRIPPPISPPPNPPPQFSPLMDAPMVKRGKKSYFQFFFALLFGGENVKKKKNGLTLYICK